MSMIGSTLGPYEITAKLGEGGMGEVYRATDSKLRREVAIKVLPETLSTDPDRLARFEREAQLLASLNHPNIASIYGLEDSAEIKALVLELVEGETLDQRIERHPLSISETIEIARQIAEALEAAHEKSIVHRDLKPQNIKLTENEVVKVLDFGLAKALDPGAGSIPVADLSMSPTLLNSPTLTAAGTAMGVILGTAAYMAPEQAKGKRVDRRADIWAFGVVLWECLTGKPLFAADTLAETLGYVMTREPDTASLPSETPVALRRLVARCLVRDPRQRLQAIGDARVELERLAAGVDSDEGEAGRTQGRPSLWAVASGAAIGAVATLLVFALAGGLRFGDKASHGDGNATRTRRTQILGLSVVNSSGVAISPDSSEVIGYDVTPSKPGLLRRSLDSFDVRPIPAAESAFNPFYSPDGESIGFFSGTQICVLELSGSSRRCLAEAHGFASGHWGRDDSIVFSSQPPSTVGEGGIWRVASAGGEARRLTTVDPAKRERQHLYPQLLPDGRNVLFTVLGELQNSLAIAPLEGGSPGELLVNATRGRVMDSGHLVYWDEPRGRLSAVRFDAKGVAVVGSPIELGIELNTTGDGIVSFDVSDNGTLVYSLGGMFGSDFNIEKIDRHGQRSNLIEERRSWAQPRVSPDGRQMLLRMAAQPDCSLWSFDLERNTLSRFSSEGDHHNPIWRADSESFAISTLADGRPTRRIVEQRFDGSGTLQDLLEVDFNPLAESISADGRFVALTHEDRRDRNDIFIHDRQTAETTPFLTTEYDEDHPVFSPDGTLLAYAANDSGRSEVYVRPFPGPGRKYLISDHGGTGPVWSRDGRELFYAADQKMMRVEITRSPRFAASPPEVLFESADFVWERPRNYDVLPDGSGFVIVSRGSGTPTVRTLRVVFDWFTELESLLPSEVAR